MKKYFFGQLAVSVLTLACSVGQVARASAPPPSMQDPQLTRGSQAVHSMTGCFAVDYNYVETEALKPGYVRDPRVYDVDAGQTIKEWIFAEDISPTRIRLQHILFAVDLQGNIVQGSFLKHTGEDWSYEPSFMYQFTGPQTWTPKDMTQTTGQWVRSIINLDDGPRYACAAAWDLTTAYPAWTCNSYAPIPGRETRDMGRTDYNTLQRSSHLEVYSSGSWLERQFNVKTIDDGHTQTPLAKEVGKEWYVRLPDSECLDAQAFLKPELPFWITLRATWDTVMTGQTTFIEKTIQGASRYSDIMDLETKYDGLDLSNSQVNQQAEQDITAVIAKYRGP